MRPTSRTSCGKPATHPADRDHRQAHRAVADASQPALRVLGAAEQLAGRGTELVAQGDQAVHGSSSRRLVPVVAGEQLAHGARGPLLLRPARPTSRPLRLSRRIQLGLTDHVEQVVHRDTRPYRRRFSPILPTPSSPAALIGYSDGRPPNQIQLPWPGPSL